MKDRRKNFVGIVCSTVLVMMVSTAHDHELDWGFYAHRRINFLAVFVLPPRMLPFFRKNIEFIREHAVDPDRRRYAQVAEAPKHYIDIDSYTKDAAIPLLGDFVDIFKEYITVFARDKRVSFRRESSGLWWILSDRDSLYFSSSHLQSLYFFEILPQRHQSNKEIIIQTNKKDSTDNMLHCRVEDSLSEKGMNPYHLEFLCGRLVKAFRMKDNGKVLRHATDIGHYIADLCVPLHTTSNYDGQKTGQNGIHAFWESRIPELYAKKEFDSFVRDVAYIDDFGSYFREIALESYSLLPQLYTAEKKARKSLEADQINCFWDRKGVQVRTQCPIFAQRFRNAMEGMVERRWRTSIWIVASVWYSCWVKAGHPSLDNEFMGDSSLLQIRKKNSVEVRRPHKN